MQRALPGLVGPSVVSTGWQLFSRVSGREGTDPDQPGVPLLLTQSPAFGRLNSTPGSGLQARLSPPLAAA